jgi:hypothetical protein
VPLLCAAFDDAAPASAGFFNTFKKQLLAPSLGNYSVLTAVLLLLPLLLLLLLLLPLPLLLLLPLPVSSTILRSSCWLQTSATTVPTSPLRVSWTSSLLLNLSSRLMTATEEAHISGRMLTACANSVCAAGEVE